MKKLTISLIIVVFLALLTANTNVQAGSIPTFSIMGVTKSEIVTVKTYNFPAGKDFIARMGLIGTKGVDGIIVGTVNSGAGGSLKFTFEIPAALCGEKTIAIRLDSTTGGYYAYNWFTNSTFGSHAGGVPAQDVPSVPTMSVTSVKEDTHAVIKGSNFPKNETFEVKMGEYGTKGVDGVIVDTFELEDEEDFIKTFDIPENLKSEEKIAIRIESTDSDFVIHTWFENKTGECGGTGVANGEGAYTGIPTISILSVVEDETVTLRTYNFPANKDFKVLMGKMGTKGVGGIHVTTFNSGSGGSFIKSFDIPGDLEGDYQIAIRLQTTDGYYYAYNWFYNNTAGASVPDGYTGIPTFSIMSVEADETVTIKTNNFPADKDFKVFMGKMGTKGIGGILVTTIGSGDGGVFTETFDIPEALEGDYKIAIRLEATTGGYYAYNWFFNNTTTGEVPINGYTGIPTFSITGVVKDNTVSIKTNNFPEDVNFKVLMGKMGTKGIDGIYVTIINSGSGGTFTKTFNIPNALAGNYQIAIRLEATSGGYYAYNWFYNATYP